MLTTLSRTDKMAPSNAKANYKTYEAQARMVRAIVAAHPDVKWNYKGEREFSSACLVSPRPPLALHVNDNFWDEG